MTKSKFLLLLNEKLSGLPKNDIEERLNFYSEMIEDRMEEGLAEEDAVASIGTVDDVALQITSEMPNTEHTDNNKIKPKRHMSVFAIVLLALGSPIWFSLIITALAVFISLYVAVWAIIITFWAAFGTFAGLSLMSVILGIRFAFSGSIVSLAMIGAGLVSVGFSIISFYGCCKVTKWMCVFTKFEIKRTIGRLRKKEA